MFRPDRAVVFDLNIAENDRLLALTIQRTRRELQRLLIPDMSMNEQVKSRDTWAETLFKFASHTRKYADEICVAGNTTALFEQEKETGRPSRNFVSGSYTRRLRSLLKEHSDSPKTILAYFGNSPVDAFLATRTTGELEHHRNMMNEGRVNVRRVVGRPSLKVVKGGDHAELASAVGYRAMQFALRIHPAFRDKPIEEFQCFVVRALSVRTTTAYATWLIWSAAHGHNPSADGAAERNSYYDCYYIGYGTLCSGLVSEDKDQQIVAQITSDCFTLLRGRDKRWWETERDAAVKAIDSASASDESPNQ
jgi:hypothetical protein